MYTVIRTRVIRGANFGRFTTISFSGLPLP
jgi:hypothetical protein